MSCAARSPTPLPEAVIQVRLTAPRAQATLVPACTSDEPMVELPASLQCGRESIAVCRLSVPLKVTSCSSTPIVVEQAELRQGGEMVVRWDFDPVALPHGQSITRDLGLWREGSAKLVVRYRAADDSVRELSREVAVTHPERKRRLEECGACSGDWGVHGLSGVESCNCRTKDAGQECRDGRECEGECLYDHGEEVQAASRSCSGGRCTIQLRMTRLVGRCAPFRTTFGCHSYLPDGEGERAPHIGAARVPHVCVD